MNSAALAAEMRGYLGALRRNHADFLVGAGVDPTLIAIYQLVGAAYISEVPGGKWVPDEDNGDFAFITPVRAESPLTPLAPDPWAAVRWGEICDLVAWCPKVPGDWRLRVGNAKWLGAAPLPSIDPFPVHLRSTVLNWMRAGADGLVMLSKNSAIRAQILSALDRRAVVETAAHRRSLEVDLAKQERAHLPQLLLPGGVG